MHVRSRLLCLFGFCHLIFRCHAGQAFSWAIQDVPETGTPLRECDNHRITISPLNGTTKDIGVPPYYMMAIATQDGISSVSYIGDKSSELSWQVQNRRGTQLLLAVIDSTGQTGGFADVFYDVVDGDTQCLPPAPSGPPVITANVTGTLNTCDPWGLLVTGGVKPYSITLATPSSPSMTNVTMGPSDNLYTYINRASPGTQLIAAVVDATGQWGVSSLPVNTTGSADTECNSLLSSSSSQSASSQRAAPTSSTIPLATAAPGASNRSKHTLGIALGVAFGSIALLVLAGIGLWWRRRKSTTTQDVDAYDTQFSPMDDKPDKAETVFHIPTLNSSGAGGVSHFQRSSSELMPTSVSSADGSLSIDATATEFQTTPISSPVSIASAQYTPSSTTIVAAHSPNSLRPLPTTPSPSAQSFASPSSEELLHGWRMNRKNSAHDTDSRLAGSARTSPVNALAAPPLRPAVTEVGCDIIIQHRDGGVVEELPPPYQNTRYLPPRAC